MSSSSHRQEHPPGPSYQKPRQPAPVPASYETYQSQEPLRPSQQPNHYSDLLHHDPYVRVRPNYTTNSVLASLTAKPAHKSSSSRSTGQSGSYARYIKSATPGAFGVQPSSSPFRPTGSSTSASGSSKPSVGTAPKWAVQAPASMEQGEVFDLNAAQITAADTMYFDKDSEKHMRELLSGAIGDGEDDDEGGHADMVHVEGLGEGVTLMPHQVRGVMWLKKREAAQNYGGILADDMGLGKTVQMIARICERKQNPSELKAGFGGTLVVAPLAVMEQWATEIRTKTIKGHIKVTTHHGPGRAKLGKLLQRYDVVITTFQTLASEHGATSDMKTLTDSDDDSDDSDSFIARPKKKAAAKKAACPLFDVKWLRVVIAQNIKNHNTKSAKAATALKSKYRWCLTGTPIQNKVEELYSLFKFLNIRPLNQWDTFKRQIANPIKSGQTKVAMKRLHVVLKSIMLRRTKDATINGKAILNLPGRIVKVVDCPFDEQERAFYEVVEKKMNDKLQRIVSEGSTTNYTSVLTLLLRLRQACLHPALLKGAVALEAEEAGLEGAPEVTVDDDDDDLADLLGGLAVDANKATQVKDENDTPARPDDSAKIRMLMKLLREIRQRNERTIVFSQFTSFLDLLGPFLDRNAIKFVRYDGSMRNDKRQESLEKIESDPNVKVILISFKAGSTGLNLTACNNVILMDLWWNPALEDQAFDRAHRLGQKLDVNIFKLTVAGTVEDRILALQDTKRELARAALSGEGAKNFSKLSMTELLGLFRSSYVRPDAEDED